jgi:serine/threonine-protein kinase
VIGQQIDGKYVITSVLGSGAMGAVYEARNVATGRTVAIKVIQSGLGTDPALVARFQREARAAGAIESTHIAQVLDAGQDRTNDAPYLVMELLKGEDLDTLVRRLGTMRYGLALRIIAQALAGLEKAHGVGVVHRDIKPANLYIAAGDAGQRVVKLVDFGIAKVKDELAASNHALTQTSALLGSPLYMSPEQAKASKKVDARADLWSLGIVLYQLLTGKAPHAHAESLTELLLAICTEDIKPVQQQAPWVPAPVAEIVERALRLDPSKRFDSARQMRDAIAAIVPDWHVLGEAMLTPLTAEERSFIAEPSASLSALGVSTGPASHDPRTASGASSSNSALALGGATNLLPLEPSASGSGASGSGAGLSGSGSGSSVSSAASSSQHSAPALAQSAGTGMGAVLGAQSQPGVGARRSARIMPFAIAGVAVMLGLGFVGLRTLRATNGEKISGTGMVETPATNAGVTTASPVTSATPNAAGANGTTTNGASGASTATDGDGGLAGASTASGSTGANGANGSTTPASAGHGAGSTGRGRPGTSATGATPSSASTGGSTATGATAPTTKPTAPATAPTAKPTTPATTSTSPISREFN